MVNSVTEVRRDPAAISYFTLDNLPIVAMLHAQHTAYTKPPEPNRERGGWSSPARLGFVSNLVCAYTLTLGLPGGSVNWSTNFEVEHFFYATLF